MSYYEDIRDITGCSPKDASLIEEIMHIHYPALDDLSPEEFAEMVRTAHEVLPAVHRSLLHGCE